MRDEPIDEIKRLISHLSEPTKDVISFRQQDGGHGSRNPLRNV